MEAKGLSRNANSFRILITSSAVYELIGERGPFLQSKKSKVRRKLVGCRNMRTVLDLNSDLPAIADCPSLRSGAHLPWLSRSVQRCSGICKTHCAAWSLMTASCRMHFDQKSAWISEGSQRRGGIVKNVAIVLSSRLMRFEGAS